MVILLSLGHRSRRTKVPRIFQIFGPNLHRRMLQNFPEFFEDFLVLFPGQCGPLKIHQESPAFFNAKSPGKSEEKSTKVFWRAGKVTIQISPTSGGHLRGTCGRRGIPHPSERGTVQGFQKVFFFEGEKRRFHRKGAFFSR